MVILYSFYVYSYSNSVVFFLEFGIVVFIYIGVSLLGFFILMFVVIVFILYVIQEYWFKIKRLDVIETFCLLLIQIL